MVFLTNSEKFFCPELGLGCRASFWVAVPVAGPKSAFWTWVLKH